MEKIIFKTTLLLGAIFLYSCEDSDSATLEKNGNTYRPLAPNELMRVSYDSEVVLTATKWNAGIVGSLGKNKKVDADEERLLDYRDTKKKYL